MPFEKGHKLGEGRPKGSPNVINREGREMMHAFFQGEFKKLSKSIDESDMSDYQKWTVLLKMASFIYPTQKAVMMDVDLDVNTMTDQQAGQILGALIEKHIDNDTTKESK